MAYPGPPHDQNPYPPSAAGHSQGNDPYPPVGTTEKSTDTAGSSSAEKIADLKSEEKKLKAEVKKLKEEKKEAKKKMKKVKKEKKKEKKRAKHSSSSSSSSDDEMQA